MENNEPKKQTTSLANLTRSQLLGLAVCFAGATELLRNLGRVIRHEDAVVSALISAAAILLGVWCYKKQKKS